jgi:hypothetical protein
MRRLEFPLAIGAAFAEFDFIIASFSNSFSILRCSCGWGRLVFAMARLSHRTGGKRSAIREIQEVLLKRTRSA